MAGVALGALFAIVFQPQIIKEISQTDILNIKSYYKVIIDSISSDIQINTEKQKYYCCDKYNSFWNYKFRYV